MGRRDRRNAVFRRMPVYTVSHVTRYLREILEQDRLLRDVWVEGEVADLTRATSGHTYFSLKDRRNTIRCVMFHGSYGAESLVTGSSVVVHGRVTVYEARGDLQLIADIVQPDGVGELQMKLEQLKTKLDADGLFEPSRKRALPAFPRRIGVVTSPTGAVWHDILTVVERRYPLVELLLAPAAVQGPNAAPTIVEALATLSQEPDLDAIIVARGGGSLEDLWAFNEESVARAIFASPVAVVAAIGHETDVTIADMVADQRAPTPSAAAEMMVPDRAELLAALMTSEQTMHASISDNLRQRRSNLDGTAPRLQRSVPQTDGLRLRIDDLLKNTVRLLQHNIDVRTERARGLAGRLELLSPLDTVRRGYAIVQRRDDGSVVREVEQIDVGETVDVTLSRGGFDAQVSTTRDSGDVNDG